MKLPAIVQKTVAVIRKAAQNLTAVSTPSWMGWWGRVSESYAGAWQQNVAVDAQSTILAFSAVFSCVTGIASDVAKNRIKLSRNVDGIWTEITANQPWLAVLRKPNHYQNRIKFVETWIVSKLLYGNAYVLKGRDQRGVVNALYVLDPNRVVVLVAEDGSVFYQLRTDYLSGVDDALLQKYPTAVPASEIIHDMMVSLWHPLVGVSPIYACGISATMGNRIQANSTNQFANMSRPGGILTAPGAISDETAARLKAAFETNFSGANVGKLAVLGDGLKFEAMILPAEAQQLIEQLRWTVEDVARAFHYPLFKLGGPLPPYSGGPQTLTMMYYTDCLQALIESLELCLDEGLALPSDIGTELDIDNLLRMDTAALYDSNGKAVGGGWMKPNEARFRANYEPVIGGDTPFLQQQMWSLEQLSKRSGPTDAPAATVPVAPPAAEPVKQLPAAKFLDAEEIEMFETELRELTLV